MINNIIRITDTIYLAKISTLSDTNVDFYEPKWTVYVRCLEKISLIVNSSANFVFYSLFGRELRNRMKNCLLCFLCLKRRKGNIRKSVRFAEKRTRFHLEKIETLYDIDEHEEDDISPIVITNAPPTNVMSKVRRHL